MDPRQESETIGANAEAEKTVDSPEDLMSPDQRWLYRASLAFQDSTDYFESSIYTRWRANLANFHNEHAPGSKYNTDSYNNRSKIFRPKPRSIERGLSAQAAIALFSNIDIANIEGLDPNNPDQAKAAKLHQKLLHQRLDTDIAWFLTALGAYQDTNVTGICISRQQWDYETRNEKEYEMAFDELTGDPIVDEQGNLMGYETVTEEVLNDKPVVKLLAPENFRFDPNADWNDVIGTSPYLIELIPMFAVDVMAKMEVEDPEGGDPDWIPYTLGQILTAGADGHQNQSSVKVEREGKDREDPMRIKTQNEYTPRS